MIHVAFLGEAKNLDSTPRYPRIKRHGDLVALFTTPGVGIVLRDGENSVGYLCTLNETEFVDDSGSYQLSNK